MILRTIEYLKPSPGDNILEIGMANGYYVKNILSADESIKYTGCDYSELMVQEAKELNKKFVENGSAEFHLTSAGNLPFNDNYFDKLFTINTLYFWDEPQQILKEFSRVLKPNGKLIITYRPKKVMDNIPFVRHGFNVYSDEEV